MCDVVVVVVECFLQSVVELGLVHSEVKEVQVEDEDVDESVTDILESRCTCHSHIVDEDEEAVMQ